MVHRITCVVRLVIVVVHRLLLENRLALMMDRLSELLLRPVLIAMVTILVENLLVLVVVPQTIVNRGMLMVRGPEVSIRVVKVSRLVLIRSLI